MNTERRKIINAQLEKLQDVQCSIESIQSEEQEYYDTMLENFQNSEKGEAASAAAEALQNAVDQLSEAMNSLEESISQ